MRDGQVARFLATSDVLVFGLISFGKPDNRKKLSDVLTSNATPKYYLSPRACRGILRRAEKRGKEIPEALKRALETVASGEASIQPSPQSGPREAEAPQEMSATT